MEGEIKVPEQHDISQILTAEVSKLPKDKQERIKKQLDSCIKGETQQLDLYQCGLKGTEINYEFLLNRQTITKIYMCKYVCIQGTIKQEFKDASTCQEED